MSTATLNSVIPARKAEELHSRNADKGSEVGRVSVLLIGKSARGSSSLSNRLRKRGCDCRTAISRQEVCQLLDNYSFDLVLSPIRLNGESLYPLIGWLVGSATTLFFSQKVENGCWWLPALRFGTNCFGAPALHPREFGITLDNLLGELQRRLREDAETRPAIASRVSGSIEALAFPGRVSFAASPVRVKSMGLRPHKALG